MIYATLAVTVDLLWGFTGILTFGQAAFFGVGAYATAMTMTSLGSTPAWMAAALALAIVVPMVALGSSSAGSPFTTVRRRSTLR